MIAKTFLPSTIQTDQGEPTNELTLPPGFLSPNASQILNATGPSSASSTKLHIRLVKS
jgi:hypothetical protein